jgi:Cu-Zn family superoxide dismutase
MGRAAGAAALAAAITTAGLSMAATSGAEGIVASAELVDGTGATVGHVEFKGRRGGVVGTVEVRLPADSSRFHGFHLHANGDPSNGTGCVGPAFTSADGHWNPGGTGHGTHAGDLPPLILGPDGRSRARFTLPDVGADDLRGLAVIVHAGPDNLANIPTRYSAAGVAGPDAATLATGDAGGRFACGVLAPGR